MHCVPSVEVYFFFFSQSVVKDLLLKCFPGPSSLHVLNWYLFIWKLTVGLKIKTFLGWDREATGGD